jgi:hypothetical protein
VLSRWSHISGTEKNGFYVDPQWCSERLNEDEPFVGSQGDPFCGIGRYSDAARRCGYKTYATDIVDRGYQHFDRTLNFLLCERALGNNIVTNPTRVPRDPRDRADPFPSPRGRPPRRSAARVTVITIYEVKHVY